LNAILNAFLLSLIAGLGTGVGCLLAISRKPGRRSFGLLMGLTEGVMISLSFLGLVNEAWALNGFRTATLGFGAGAFFMLLIDISVPHVRFGESEARTWLQLPAAPLSTIRWTGCSDSASPKPR
jgi:ZIP family zinc transporter